MALEPKNTDSGLRGLAGKAVKHTQDCRVQYCDACAEFQELKPVLIKNVEMEYPRTEEDGTGARFVNHGM